MTSVDKDLTGVDASVAGVAAAAGSQVQQTSAAGASEAPRSLARFLDGAAKGEPRSAEVRAQVAAAAFCAR